MVRSFAAIDASLPACHLLSNQKYCGDGQLRRVRLQPERGDTDHRWREDSLSGKMGQYIFLHQVNTSRTWSATYQPLDKQPDDYQ